MANLILSRPQASAHQALNIPPGSRLVLDFPTDQATLGRAGDNLTFSFEDGSLIELTDFYTEYSRADLPDFEINGELVAGEKFFEAFAPDLLPAAGPAQTVRETHDSGLEDSGALMRGLDHLESLHGSQGAPSAPESGPAALSSPWGGVLPERASGSAQSAGPGENAGPGGGSGGEPPSGPYLDFVERVTDTPLHIAQGEVSIDPVLHGNLASVFRFGGLEQGGSLRLDVTYTDGKGGAHNYVFTWSGGALGIADAQGNVVNPEDLPFGLSVDAATGLASFYKAAGIDPQTGENIYSHSHVLDVTATLTGPDGAQLQSGPHRLEADGAQLQSGPHRLEADGAQLQSGPHRLEADGALTPAPDGSVHLEGGAATDHLVGGGHNDTLEGGLGADKLYGGAGDDTLLGAWKTDRLPSESFTVSGNRLDGGSGNDMLAGIVLEKSGTDLMTGGALTVTGNTLLGGEGDDKLYGAQLGVYAPFSNDYPAAMSGGQLSVTRNILVGGEGDDTLYGAKLASLSSHSSLGMREQAQLTVSENKLYGGEGDDKLYGAQILANATGSYWVDATALTRTARVSVTGNEFDGGDGNDLVYGAQINATFTDTATGSADSPKASALSGNAQLSVTGNNTLRGGEGDDRLYGAQLMATVPAGSSAAMRDKAQLTVSQNDLYGDDMLVGALLLSTNSYASASTGMAGDTKLTVSGNELHGGGADILHGAQLNATTEKNDSASVLDGSAHLNIEGNKFYGGDGNDTLYGAQLNATAWSEDGSGEGPAAATVLAGDAQLSVTGNKFDGGSGDDNLFGAHLSAGVFTAGGRETASALSGSARLSVTDNEFDGGSGDDVITGLHMQGDIRDYAVVDFSHNKLLGGEGDDVIRVEHIQGDISSDAFLNITDNYLDGGAGADKIYGGRGTDIIAYDTADMLVDGGKGTDFLLVGSEDDLNALFGAGQGGLGASGQTVQRVEAVLSGNGVQSLTDLAALARHGIRVNDDGSISLGDGWQQQGGAGHQDYVAWSNGDLTLNVSQGTTVEHNAAAGPDLAGEAALKMAVENG